MKKLNLSGKIQVRQLISRDQLKSVLGGLDGSDDLAQCTCANGTKCPAGTRGCSTTYDSSGNQLIQCGSDPYKPC